MLPNSWRGGGSTRGGGPSRGGGSPRGGGASKQGGYCHTFFDTGRCHFGDRCKYPHVKAPGGNNNNNNTASDGPWGHNNRTEDRESRPAEARPARPRNDRPRDDRPEAFRQWNDIVRSSQSATAFPAITLKKFFKLGLELMDSDVGVVQEVIGRLATDGGLWLIKDVTDRLIPEATGESVLRQIWGAYLSPLFDTITHPRVEDSALLEKQLFEIYGFLQGFRGGVHRTKTVFDFCLLVFEKWSAFYGESLTVAPLDVTCNVLSKLLDCSTKNIVNDDFQPIVVRLATLLNGVSEGGDAVMLSRTSKRLQYMQRRLGLGESLPILAGTNEHPNRTAATFKLSVDLPGSLSRDGPRHDNDNEAIHRIRILPTFREIMSPRAEYLPTNDPSLSHLPGLAGLLDRHFRLLREDTVGQLRDAVRTELEWQQKSPGSSHKKDRSARNELRTFVYDNAVVMDVQCDPHNGLELRVQCEQPQAVRSMTSDKRRQEWWEMSKRLQPGALVCIVDSTESVIFAVISEDIRQKKKDFNDSPEEKLQPKHALSKDAQVLEITLHLAREDCSDVAPALRWGQDLGQHRRSRCLVEFPGILLASFEHTLSALQFMSQKLDVPFADILAPTSLGSLNDVVDIPRPLYTHHPGFSFDLSCLSKDKSTLSHSATSPTTTQDIMEKTTLDETQSDALLNTLNRGLSCIQGPPGTGKSYTGQQIIRALLANAKKAALGPIICVCYTNHALDQLLEHLLDDGVENILRIGSQSKSERLALLNMREVAKNITRTKTEKSVNWKCHQSLKALTATMRSQIDDLEKATSEVAIERFLKINYPSHGIWLFGQDKSESEWKEVRSKKKDVIPKWISRGDSVQTGRPPRSVLELTTLPLDSLTRRERIIMHSYWLKKIRDNSITQIHGTCLDFIQAKTDLDRVRGEIDLRCLKQAQVVGVTTTGLARNVHLLRRLRSKVVVCEEAGEVLEAHLLTALLPSVEHAILIGDHQQLRPNIQNYGLQSNNPAGARYSLDVSLFERLVEPQHGLAAPRIPLSILDTQRRMHPAISELVRSTLYPNLKDVEHVANYPAVPGIRHRLFWLHHTHPEDRAGSNEAAGTSHTHTWEVAMATDLASHLVRQGIFLPGKIAVLTPYLGQLRQLRKSLGQRFEVDINERDLSDLEVMEADEEGSTPESAAVGDGVVIAKSQSATSQRKKIGKSALSRSIRAATVDRFQGDEADVVIISLVRSNEQKRCGFLSVSNRINVLLSRARHGMYIIGNAETYGTIQMWRDVLGMLRAEKRIGDALELQCPRHPETPMAISQPDDFPRFSPDGGCGLPCSRRLGCGHACTGRCHADVMHDAVKCLEDCQRMKQGCDHSCPRRCGDECESRCNVVLKNLSLKLNCGHVAVTAKCWQNQNLDSIRCEEMMLKTVPGCGHEVKTQCSTDVSGLNYICGGACGSNLACGHTCKKQCWKCRAVKQTILADGTVEIHRSTVNHGECIHICGRKYTACQHSCRKRCHGDVACDTCEVPCEVRCNHSTCGKMCYEPCVPCAEENCASRCPHSQCTLPCAAPCDWVPCSKRCEEKLACGHQCPAVCGETCPNPKFCQTCGAEDVKGTVVDFIEMATYAEVNLNEDPCIFPDCGHFFTRSNMDGMMSMGEHYKLSDSGEPTAILDARRPFSQKDIKACSSCRGSLRNVSRYGRIVRGSILDESWLRFIIWSKTAQAELGPLLVDEMDKLAGTPKPKPRHSTQKKVLEAQGKREHQVSQLRKWIGGERYDTILKLRQRIVNYASVVAREEQPFQRVADLVQSARQRQKTEGVFVLDESRIQFGSIIGGWILLLRLDLAIFNDAFLIVDDQAWREYDFGFNPTRYLQDGQRLLDETNRIQNPRQQVEAHIILARLHILSSKCYHKIIVKRDSAIAPEVTAEIATTDAKIVENTAGGAPIVAFPTSRDTREVHTGKVEKLRETAKSHLETARTIIKEFPSAAMFSNEINMAERALNSGTFYADVSAQEKHEVYQAMGREFLGTGHWYTCQRGHPFTVGECGMPMERARCPDCGAAVGGENHRPDQGVTRDNAMEELGRLVGQMQAN